jgi:hypothetical protein
VSDAMVRKFRATRQHIEYQNTSGGYSAADPGGDPVDDIPNDIIDQLLKHGEIEEVTP